MLVDAAGRKAYLAAKELHELGGVLSHQVMGAGRGIHTVQGAPPPEVTHHPVGATVPRGKPQGRAGLLSGRGECAVGAAPDVDGWLKFHTGAPRAADAASAQLSRRPENNT